MSKTGDLIKKERTQAGISIRELARRVNMSHSSLANIESGKTKRIDIEQIHEIALALDIHPGTLTPIEESSYYTDKILSEEVEELRQEVESLQEDLKEAHEVVELLRVAKDSVKSHFAMLFVSNIQYILSQESDVKKKEELFKFYNKMYVYYMKAGVLQNSDIIHIYTGMESAYSSFIEWYKNIKRED